MFLFYTLIVSSPRRPSPSTAPPYNNSSHDNGNRAVLSFDLVHNLNVKCKRAAPYRRLPAVIIIIRYYLRIGSGLITLL